MLFCTDWLTKLQYEHLVGQNGMPTYRQMSLSFKLSLTERVTSEVSRQSLARSGLTSYSAMKRLTAVSGSVSSSMAENSLPGLTPVSAPQAGRL